MYLKRNRHATTKTRRKTRNKTRNKTRRNTRNKTRRINRNKTRNKTRKQTAGMIWADGSGNSQEELREKAKQKLQYLIQVMLKTKTKLANVKDKTISKTRHLKSQLERQLHSLNTAIQHRTNTLNIDSEEFAELVDKSMKQNASVEQMHRQNNKPHIVYGLLLQTLSGKYFMYVGMTSHPQQRWLQHQRELPGGTVALQDNMMICAIMQFRIANTKITAETQEQHFTDTLKKELGAENVQGGGREDVMRRGFDGMQGFDPNKLTWVFDQAISDRGFLFNEKWDESLPIEKYLIKKYGNIKIETKDMGRLDIPDNRRQSDIYRLEHNS